MAILLVTYDLNKEGTSKVDYDKFYKLRDTYDHVKLSESSYAFNTSESPTDLYNKLKPLIDANDDILVITLKKPYYGYHRKPTIAWLDSKLTFC